MYKHSIYDVYMYCIYIYIICVSVAILAQTIWLKPLARGPSCPT